jgi:hypothetical protein
MSGAPKSHEDTIPKAENAGNAELIERLIARAICTSLRRKKDALVSGAPGVGDRTIIDGTFNLRRVARSVRKQLIVRGGINL